MKAAPWTSEQAAQAIAMKRAGTTSDQIGATMGLSGNAVRNRLRKLGCVLDSRARWTAEKRATLAELWATKMDSAAIAEVIGLTPKAIRSQARHMDLPKRGTGGPRSRAARPAGGTVVRRYLPGIISAPFASVAILTPPTPKALPPLRSRILASLAKGPSDSLNLSSACEAKELQVTQELACLESEGRVSQSPCAGLRSRSWSLAMQEAA